MKIKWGFIDPDTGEFIEVSEEGMRKRWGPSAVSKREDFWCGCTHPKHAGFICGYPLPKIPYACECEG